LIFKNRQRAQIASLEGKLQQVQEQMDQANMEKSAFMRKVKMLEKRVQDSNVILQTAQSDAEHFKEQVFTFFMNKHNTQIY
jgi:chromosome segregation ATPase